MVVLIASILLGLSFLVAGGAKLAAGPSWPAEARALGAPGFVVPVVPWFELALGAGLVTQLARRPSAVVAIATLVVFTALLGARLRDGVRPPCACFGAWSTRPLGPGHLLRNGILLALAVVSSLP
ncbi:MAG: MauE/DoxX family redox-associated membrane protein [Actinomycetota bacterium]